MATIQTILVVDHETSARRQIVRSLVRAGFCTIEAESGPHALALFEQAGVPVDLAIIDMAIPQMSGLDLAAELGRLQDTLKFLYLSSHSRSIAIDSICQRSPEYLLVKPFSEQSLVDRVLGLLRGITRPSVRPSSQPDNQSGWPPTPG